MKQIDKDIKLIDDTLILALGSMNPDDFDELENLLMKLKTHLKSSPYAKNL